MDAGGEPNRRPRDGEADAEGGTARAPLFPLPNLVFFPETYQALHVFEPRYRALVEAALAGPGLIAVVLAREERPEGAWPAIHRVGSLGRIVVADALEDGRWNLVLRGLARVRLERLHEEPGGWFSAALEALGEALPDLQDPDVARAKSEFVLTAMRYSEQVLGGGLPEEFLGDRLPYPVLVGRAASLLRVDVRTKQALLERNDMAERARAIERRMREEIEARRALERFEKRRPEEPRAN